MKNRSIKPRPALTHVAGQERSSYLLRMLHQQQTLLEQVRQLLPSPVADHCLHARIEGTQLILHTDSSAWMTRLRFHGPHLIKALLTRAPHLKTLKTRVLITPPQFRPRCASRGISRHSAESIQNIAKSVSDDKLRAALLRLGKIGLGDQEEA